MTKKIVTLVLCIMFIASLGLIGVRANNSSDTTFSFNFFNEWSPSTPARAKLDNSSSYMNCQSSAYTYTASVFGRYNQYDNQWDDVSNGYKYNFTTGTVHYMTNWAYEWGYGYAGIIGYGATGSCTASGLWSPDSV